MLRFPRRYEPDDDRPAEAARRLAAGGDFLLLDVRSPDEGSGWQCVAGATNLPMAEIPGRLAEIDRAKEVAVMCHHGVRSAQVAAYPREPSAGRASPPSPAASGQAPPIRVIVPGRTYRWDSDATHTPMFHQMEGLVIDRAIHMGHLKWTLETFIARFFETAWSPASAPTTSPSPSPRRRWTCSATAPAAR